MGDPLTTFALIVLFVIASVLLIRLVLSWAESTSNRLTRLEEKLDRLLAALNVPLTSTLLRPPTINSPILTDIEGLANSKVGEWLRRGQKINAIKVYREQTGMGLRESKDAVDALAAEMKASGMI